MTSANKSYWTRKRQNKTEVSCILMSTSNSIQETADTCPNNVHNSYLPETTNSNFQLGFNPSCSTNRSKNHVECFKYDIVEESNVSPLQYESDSSLDFLSNSNSNSLSLEQSFTDEEDVENGHKGEVSVFGNPSFANCDVRTQLANWATNFNIPIVAVSSLLQILSPNFLDLPKDPRTLLKTKRVYEINHISKGEYYHFGFENGILRVLAESQVRISRELIFKVQVNIDGLPLFKSSNIQLWPILGKLVKPLLSNVFVIGIFCGCEKPGDVNEYLKPFIDEVLLLNDRGIDIGIENTIPVHLSCIICDAPARAMLKRIKPHNAYHGCERCTQRGKWESKITFPDVHAPRRTDEMFRDMTDAVHHVSLSPLHRIPSIGLVSQFPLDPMHLVYLGVTKRLIGLWMKGPVGNSCRIGQSSIRQVSEALLACKPFIPREFSRKCRALKEVDRWKATEYRQFLLYSGVVVLKGRIQKHFYKHFLVLSVAIYCLASPIHCQSHCHYAEELLLMFVQEWGEIYGKEMLVYNVHSLINLASDVHLYRPLDSFSAFPFESFLGRMKRMVRKPNYPLSQIIRRLLEKEENCNSRILIQRNEEPNLVHFDGPLPSAYQGYCQFREIWRNGLFFSCSNGNNCVKVRSHYCLIQNIIQGKDSDGKKNIYFLYKVFTHIEDFFVYPLASSQLGIVKVSRLSDDVHSARISDINCKFVMLPHKQYFILIHQFY